MTINKEKYLPRILSVLDVSSKRYRDPIRALGCDSTGSMVAYTTHMVDNIANILDIDALHGMMSFQEAVSTITPFLEEHYKNLGFEEDMWKLLAMNTDRRLSDAWHKLKVVCNQ